MVVLDGTVDPARSTRLWGLDESDISLEERAGRIVIGRSSSGGIRVAVLGRFRGTSTR
ncbi:MAG: hypothetical protein ACE5OY_08265 [Candidatus Bathyarchaeia archaeon]